MNPERNPHVWFFSYMNETTEPAERAAKRKELIKEYSGGKTDSLSDLYENYPRCYELMRADLSPADIVIKDARDIHRKRLIAALFEFLANQESRKPKEKRKPVSMDLVKAVAARAARANSFNEIPLNKLKSLYRAIGEKNFKELDSAVKDLINETI